MMRHGNRVDGTNEDAITVQTSNANSHLGTQLLEGDWNEAIEYLDSPEGRRDASANNDPIGLFSGNKNTKVPKHKNSSFFASLFVRAPYEVVEKIYSLDNNGADRTGDDLMYVLSVIPSEEAERLKSMPTHQATNTTVRSRTWDREEHEIIIYLLLRHAISQPNTSSQFLRLSQKWILPTVSLTPLAIAAYNPDISAHILRLICALEPRAVNTVVCEFFGVKTLPLFIAAASPIPSKESNNYVEFKNNRWEKVQSLVIDLEWYSQQRQSVLSILSNETEAIHNLQHEPPEPTLEQITLACKEAIRRNEWELVREFLKRANDDERMPEVQAQLETHNLNPVSGKSDSLPVATAVPEPMASREELSHTSNSLSSRSAALQPIQEALYQHDKNIQQQNQVGRGKGEKVREMDEWAHKNMGLVMYHVDAMLDLASAFIPSSWLKKGKGSRGGGNDTIDGIVGPMS